jgi:hypothetical protein
MEVPIADELKKHDFAVVHEMAIGLKAPDRRFQSRDVRRPRIAERLCLAVIVMPPSTAAVCAMSPPDSDEPLPTRALAA